MPKSRRFGTSPCTIPSAMAGLTLGKALHYLFWLEEGEKEKRRSGANTSGDEHSAALKIVGFEKRRRRPLCEPAGSNESRLQDCAVDNIGQRRPKISLTDENFSIRPNPETDIGRTTLLPPLQKTTLGILTIPAGSWVNASMAPKVPIPRVIGNSGRRSLRNWVMLRACDQEKPNSGSF